MNVNLSVKDFTINDSNMALLHDPLPLPVNNSTMFLSNNKMSTQI